MTEPEKEQRNKKCPYPIKGDNGTARDCISKGHCACCNNKEKVKIIKLGQYQCGMCHEVFNHGWPEEEAKKEAESKGLDIKSCGLVCDDCYKKTPWGMANAI